jgi:trimeric autotransporter adhesin
MIPRFVLTSVLLLTIPLAITAALPQATGQLPATTPVNKIAGLAIDLHSGALYIADKGKSVIYRVAKGGVITPFAGNGLSGFDGDGKSALDTQFNHPLAISLDQRTGELFIADTKNYRIRAISPKNLKVSTVAGIGTRTSSSRIPYDSHTPGALAAGHIAGDGGPATEAEFNLPSGVCADPIGILFIADSGNHRVRAVNRGTSPVYLMGVEIGPGNIETIAGTGTLGFSGDGGKATHAQLAFPTELRVDASGSLLIVDSFNQRLRKIDRQSGIIRTVAAGEISEVPPERALEHWATSVVGASVTMNQEIIYTDRVNHSVHRLSRGGENRVIYSAQPHEYEFGSVEIDAQGEIYVADVHWNRVLRIDGTTASVYVGGTTPGTIRFGVNTSSVKRIE